MNAHELYRAGKLGEAVDAQTLEVRAHPGDIERRCFLAELLCIAGNLDRADSQLETIEKLEAGTGPGLALLRQLIRAEKARREVHLDGRLPEFLEPPGAAEQLYLRALVVLRGGDLAGAAAACAQAEELRGSLAGTSDGKRFDDFRDLDDLHAGYLELLTSTGKYYWVPLARIVSLELDPPARPIDLLWRPASLSVSQGPDGKVYLPAVYCTAGGSDEAALLGRSTDWVGGEGEPVRGLGLRTFLVGEEARTILELGSIAFDPPREAGS